MSDNLTKEQPANLTKYPMSQTPLITYDMVNKLQCVLSPSANVPISVGDAEPKAKWDSPCLMMIFDGGDLNSAMHHLLASLRNPFAPNAVATLLIQENVRGPFLEQLVEQMTQVDPSVHQHPNYLRTLRKLQQFSAETIVANPHRVPSNATPILVSDLTHNFLGEDGPTGVITMHTFRTPKEATQVNLKETLAYGSVSIWNEKTASAYEMCQLLKNNIFMINCYNVDLGPIKAAFDAGQNDARIVKGYHYESVICGQMRKIIVFAVGTIFAN
ncbi:uncharacterized protein LOC6564824 isoform X2 [Drosophila grimshawi]|uniref:uncharacterized protein LOC6564824 isoform X2 n=1 Tax=Drosophila grimshawi TaxID=7222 RepID=UPI000C870E5D|nr:uncharacterized protein LOC6564824 isoform X2 [Drosophila grimshawi]